MTWTKFTILLLGAYGFYYGFNILRDYLKQPKAKATGSHQSLQLVEDVQPVVVDDADFAPPTVGEPVPPRQPNSDATEPEPQAASVEAAREDSTPRQQPESGGVSLSELLRLYRQKAILQSAQYDFTT